jgi:2-methylcitrate dehydratase PrpD
MSRPVDPSTTRPEAELAAFVADLTHEDVPDAARTTIERAFVDTVGVTLAGAVADAGARTATLATAVGEGETTVLGTGETAPLTDAVLANGTAGHALDYDDLSWAMDGHPSVPIVAPALALGEWLDASGRDVVAAFAAGFEAECYVAEPVSPTHYEAGWHPTSTFGTFGAAATAASLLDLSAEETARALAIAASMPAGLKRNFGTMTKPLHAGLAGRSGVTAALLARDGFTADDAAISGERGFWELYADGAERRADPPGDPWRLLEAGISVKAYPCCYFTHTGVALAAALADDHGLLPDDIARIEAAVSRGAGDALVHPDPETGLEAKFSMEYALAAGVVFDRVGLAAFEPEALSDPEVQHVRERASFRVDDSLSYKSNYAEVVVETVDGDRFADTMKAPPGTPANPLTETELRAKFTECATRVLDDDAAETAFESLRSLRTQSSVRDLLAPL